MRPDWDSYFMQIANLVATRSTCLRRQVGAVLVKNNRILATGYNGAPSKLEHCYSIGCVRKKERIPSGEKHELCRAVHAEQNVIIQCAKYGISTQDSILYCTHFPCVICAKMLINAEIKKIFYKNSYQDPLSKNILKEAQIEIIKL